MLWSRNAEIAVLDTCRDIGAAFVAFSPVARAFLTGALRDVATLNAKDIRRSMPRFAPEAYAANLRLLGTYSALARQAGCTPGQLALARLLARSPQVLPIPGTTQSAHLRENLAAAELVLRAGLMAQMEVLFPPAAITGARYSAANQAEIDTEDFDT